MIDNYLTQASSPQWVEGLVSFVVGDGKGLLPKSFHENKAFARAFGSLESRSVQGRDKRHDEAQVLGHLLAAPWALKPIVVAYQQAAMDDHQRGYAGLWRLYGRLMAWLSRQPREMLNPETRLPRFLAVISRPDAVVVAKRQLQKRLNAILAQHGDRLLQPGHVSGASDVQEYTLADLQRYLREIDVYLLNLKK